MSVRLFIRWNRQSGDRAIEAVSDDASHIEVEAQSGNDDAFCLEVSVIARTGSILGENEVEYAPKVDETTNSVDDFDGAVAKVERRDGNRISHVDLSGWYQGQSILNGVDLLAKPQSEAAA